MSAASDGEEADGKRAVGDRHVRVVRADSEEPRRAAEIEPEGGERRVGEASGRGVSRSRLMPDLEARAAREDVEEVHVADLAGETTESAFAIEKRRRGRRAC